MRTERGGGWWVGDLNPATLSGDNTCAVLVRVATDVNIRCRGGAFPYDTCSQWRAGSGGTDTAAGCIMVVGSWQAAHTNHVLDPLVVATLHYDRKEMLPSKTPNFYAPDHPDYQTELQGDRMPFSDSTAAQHKSPLENPMNSGRADLRAWGQRMRNTKLGDFAQLFAPVSLYSRLSF
jgi:hypothetical protein